MGWEPGPRKNGRIQVTLPFEPAGPFAWRNRWLLGNNWTPPCKMRLVFDRIVSWSSLFLLLQAISMESQPCQRWSPGPKRSLDGKEYRVLSAASAVARKRETSTLWLCESLIPVIVGKILTKVIELADCSVRTWLRNWSLLLEHLIDCFLRSH